MHILINSAPIDIGKLGLVSCGRHIVEDVVGAELLAMADRGTARLIYDLGLMHDSLRPFDASKDWNGKRVLFMRSGGFGDMILCTPILREFRRRWPNIIVTVACRAERFSVFDGLGLVNRWIPTPVTVEMAASFDAVISYENVIEKEMAAHYVDALAAHIGLELPEGPEARQVSYAIGVLEKANAAIRYRRKAGVKRLAIQMASGSRCRSYPKNLLGEVAMALIPLGWEIYLLGLRGDAPQPAKYAGIRNLTGDGLTFRQSVAALATCDFLLAPDSSLIHVAPSVGVKALGLFAVIPSAMRVGFSPSTTAIDGRGACSPCYFHDRGGIQFPKNGPCAKTGFCTVLSEIKPTTIVAKILELS